MHSVTCIIKPTEYILSTKNCIVIAEWYNVPTCPIFTVPVTYIIPKNLHNIYYSAIILTTYYSKSHCVYPIINEALTLLN